VHGQDEIPEYIALSLPRKPWPEEDAAKIFQGLVEQIAPSGAGEVALEVVGRERPRAEALSERVENTETESRFTKIGRMQNKRKAP